MAIKLRILRSNHDGSVRINIARDTGPASYEDLIAEIEEDEHGNTLTAILSVNDERGENARLTLESLCAKVYEIGMHDASSIRAKSSPTSPPP